MNKVRINSFFIIRLMGVMFVAFALVACSNEANEENVENNRNMVHNENADREEHIIALEAQIEHLTAHFNNTRDAHEAKLAELQRQNNELQYDLMLTNKAIQSFPTAWPAVQTFVEAYFSLDLDTVQHMLSDKYTVHEESISFKYEDEELHIPHTALIRSIDNYQLNSFGYAKERSSPSMFFQVMTYDENSSGFINLYMLRRGHEWIVDTFEFDI